MNSLTPQQLLDHMDSGTLWPLLSDTPPARDLGEAYRIARKVDRLRKQRGEQARGYKIGFTNVDMWPRYGVTAPIWGRMWGTTVSDMNTHGDARIHLHGLCQPRIEPEVIFGLRASPRGTDPQDLYEAIDWVAPGFELVQSHCPDWRFTPDQAIADGGLHGRLLIGPRQPVADLAPDAVALQGILAALKMTLSRDGTVVDTGSGAKVLGNPLLALGHLVQGLSEDTEADPLTDGDIVTTGTLTDAWPLEAGQNWVAQYPGLWIDLSVSTVVEDR